MKESAASCSKRRWLRCDAAAIGEAQLFTAAANQRSRTFYERRGWRATATNAHEHDDLWLTSYERFLIN